MTKAEKQKMSELNACLQIIDAVYERAKADCNAALNIRDAVNHPIVLDACVHRNKPTTLVVGS